ncbi:ATP-binding cassette domain-containing protein [Streptomyces yaanensis]|uniref:ATP-binding cassette domain-containing protein n=1 Tax=Streptomyces yaanensis TaxID=1142239 RepID=A0ABV7SIT9_9ACTN|nr:ATP-binding cassette domain-containing protein [Streptomyces sp. CGMCC 4.7035]WNB97080.1 ATP-binding cassette domain-containing protein [Streptomyces sp. CGMCC 4.7035]
MTGPPLLALRGISKRFGAVQALKDVELEVHRGEVVALLGDNGAGKSTLIRVIAGVDPADKGVIEWEGRAVQIRTPQAAQHLGIATVYQNLALCDGLDVAENLFLGRERRFPGTLGRLFRLMDKGSMRREARRQLDGLGIRVPDVRAPVASLSAGQRQTVAISRALLGAPKVVLLDEPTAALGLQQAGHVLDLVDELREHGVGVILISHNMGDVKAVADRAAVLRLGANNGLFHVPTTPQDRIISSIIGAESNP